jgi:hypothetical protein
MTDPLAELARPERALAHGFRYPRFEDAARALYAPRNARIRSISASSS